MSEEWGPWIEHDGGPRPVKPGTFCHLIYEDGEEFIGPIGLGYYGTEAGTPDEPWGGWCPIVRYRIRKPRALLQLIEMVENLPAPAQPRVDA